MHTRRAVKTVVFSAVLNVTVTKQELSYRQQIARQQLRTQYAEGIYSVFKKKHATTSSMIS